MAERGVNRLIKGGASLTWALRFKDWIRSKQQAGKSIFFHGDVGLMVMQI